MFNRCLAGSIKRWHRYLCKRGQQKISMNHVIMEFSSCKRIVDALSIL